MTCKHSSFYRQPSSRLGACVLSLAIGIVVTAGGEARADDANKQAADNGNQVAASAEHPGYLFDWRDVGRSFGERLADHGVYLHGFYQQAYMNVVDGGNKRKGNYLGLGFWGFDIDTDKAFGLKGGLFDFTLSNQAGATATAGTSTGSQTQVPWGFGDEIRLVDFYYDQSIAHGRVHVTVGRMNQLSNLPGLSPGFHVMPWLCTFWSNSCGTPHAYNFNASHPGYQVGTWGGVITVHPAPSWYIKAGAIENSPNENISREHRGWPGRDWGLDEAHGAFIPVQVGYITTPATSLYPTNVHIGGYYDTARYTDKFYSTTGLPLASHPGAPQTHTKATGLFAGLTQTILRFSDNPKSTRGLALIASADRDITGYGDDREQFEAGFLLTGPFASRAADSLNFLMTYQTFDARLRAARHALAAAHGIDYTMKPQTGMELNYGFAVAPGVVVYPYAQYVWHPDQLPLAIPNPHNTHATVLGVRITTSFHALLGLPQPEG
ncbi:MAG TPA: carbohydrate porin [Dyella sp.]|uniref:carbohydrate porin n=1 Tax=Dyella sp. TaxID=1869338 RepID=UPI002F943E3E